MAPHGFLQDPPALGNQLTEDDFLVSLLRRLVPADALDDALPDLEHFGWEVATTIKQLGQQAEREAPTLQQYDAWGARTDTVVTSPAWRELKAVSAREGLVAAAYERRHGVHSRLLQVAKLYCFGASSGLFNCPLAMTDGAARLCELLLEKQGQDAAATQQQQELAAALQDAFRHLTSRDAKLFWTSGQWMTERGGGSDVVGGTETEALAEDPSHTAPGSWFRLHGYKWFTSAADGEISMALARERSASGTANSGSTGRGLTLFLVPVTRDADGRPQGFEVVRLKDKLGTRQLPTAELRLAGMRALKVSPAGRGVPAIAAMVNITRLHNSAAAASFMRRITALAQDYARRRAAFGSLLIHQPLAQRTLGWLHLHTAASLALTLEVAHLQGLLECGGASAEAGHMLRLLTPLAKLFTAKEAVAVVSEGIEFFGGQGYIEGTHLPIILRDAQVLPIWEGTTSVLSLDVLRVLGGSPQAAATFLRQCSARIAAASKAAQTAGGSGSSGAQAPLQQACMALQRSLPGVGSRLEAAVAAPTSPAAQVEARQLAFALARLFVGVLLAEHAAWSGEEEHTLLASEWCQECLAAEGAATSSRLQAEAQAQLHTARVLSGADSALPQPRARY
ncbi:acyl- dehydrogenase family member 11-like [Chlorella sorokiniana]|uniref:Acyl-dehydrogenase family member 11-like n=1 Tax=Chlorella sorokiniana TaxID=3076 RepID=A0A2P6TI23_CHLSO|nr:acyl- dehydrogenase family member 11-like [Chlorella sorokiniana]|eukprot:PRW33943.1 acyl- dehydrogenase family member 11-like [Chlorella sorokiniana]